MSSLLRSRVSPVLGRISVISRSCSSGSSIKKRDESLPDEVTHTGQQFAADDYRLARFVGKSKLVNQSWAIDLIAEDPVVICEERIAVSDSGGPLGHPKVYINLDPPGVHSCGYSGRKFIHKRYYNEKEHGPSITYDEYLVQIKSDPKHYPC